MNIQWTTISGFGPAAWNSGNEIHAVHIKVHSAHKEPPRKHIHINPDVQAMPEARGETHHNHWPIGLE